MDDNAKFIVSSGLREAGYVYINTDEGWELPDRSANGSLQWSPTMFPSGLPNFIEKLHSMKLKFGIYGAASGVTCGVDPGQLYNEIQDAITYAKWNVDYLKSDNCASYALDPSVRFGALRDSLNATGKAMLISIEPFSIDPDPEQSVEVSNIWRTGVDICGNSCALDRADTADKWAPLAGKGGWNDPDMIAVRNPCDANNVTCHNLDECGLSCTPLTRYKHATLGRNRIHFGLWAMMKAPLLLSTMLPDVQPKLMAIINNSAIIALNQDSLGVAARKLAIGTAVNTASLNIRSGTPNTLQPLPWLVGLASCDLSPAQYYARKLKAPTDTTGSTRTWSVLQINGDGEGTQGNNNDWIRMIKNTATGRCLSVYGSHSTTDAAPWPVVLLPCDPSDLQQHFRFDKGVNTVTSISSVSLNMSLAVSNSSLFGAVHNSSRKGYDDELAVPGNNAHALRTF
jgi:alpha-galactosidase